MKVPSWSSDESAGFSSLRFGVLLRGTSAGWNWASLKVVSERTLSPLQTQHETTSMQRHQRADTDALWVQTEVETRQRVENVSV